MFQDSPTYNEYLTGLAQAAYADEKDSIWRLLFPPVETGEVTGAYTKRDMDEAFRIYDTSLSRDGRPTRLHVDATKGYFDVEPNALEVSNWKFDMKTKGGQDFREDNLRVLMSSQIVNREFQAVKIWREGVPATAGAGVGWSEGNGDPVDEIDSCIETIYQAIGKFPELVLFGLPTWRWVKKHPKVLSQIQGIKTAASMQEFAGMLLKPDIDVRLAPLPYQEKKLGKTGPKSGIVGAEVYILYNDPAPSRSDMSAGKDFTLDAGGPEVHTEETGTSSIDQLYWSTDMKVTCAASAARIVAS